ncbi:MAG: hypothetical protein ACRCVJ_16445 [Clostridium sp.]|uniref:hypothetical protein n=1 Tax=Clostridium sp. TaxID=1506 RepID=UPI003F2B2D8A
MDYSRIVYEIDLNKFNITNGFINHSAPYTLDEWAIAYNNKIGIQEALNFACDNGYSEIRLPKGSYVICYEERKENVDIYWKYGRYPIIIPENMIIDLGFSTIKVIYDSINKNPYDKSINNKDNPVYKLYGDVFSFRNNNSTLRNGTLIGTKYERAFIDSNSGFLSEKGTDSGAGIIFELGATNNKVINMTIKGFMADGIAGTSQSKEGVIPPSKYYNPSFVTEVERDTNGNLKDKTGTGCYISDYMDISKFTGNMLMMDTTSQWVPNIKDRQFYLYYYDERKNTIGNSSEIYRHNCIIYKNASYVRVLILNEEVNMNVPFVKQLQLRPSVTEWTLISNCIITENHRGGISNTPNNTVIDRCHIYNNGKGEFEGLPVFPDTTRYAINNEEYTTNQLIIKDCYIHDHSNGILARALNIIIENSMFKNMENVIAIYGSGEDIKINNLTAYNVKTIVGFTGKVINFVERSLIMSNIRIYNGTLYRTNKAYGVDKVNILTSNIIIENGNLNGDRGEIIDQRKLYVKNNNAIIYGKNMVPDMVLYNSSDIIYNLQYEQKGTNNSILYIDKSCNNITINGDENYNKFNSVIFKEINNTTINDLDTSSEPLSKFKYRIINKSILNNFRMVFGSYDASLFYKMDTMTIKDSVVNFDNKKCLWNSFIFIKDYYVNWSGSGNLIKQLEYYFDNVNFNFGIEKIDSFIDFIYSQIEVDLKATFKNCTFTSITKIPFLKEEKIKKQSRVNIRFVNCTGIGEVFDLNTNNSNYIYTNIKE